jgi:FG-GAP repeat
MVRLLVVLSSFLVLAQLPATAQSTEPGAILREGTWNGDVGMFDVPQAFSKLKPSAWPKDNWYKVTIGETSIHSERAAMSPSGRPKFMESITSQLLLADVHQQTQNSSSPEVSAEQALPMYIRVPGAKISEGSIPVYVFKNGTNVLQPQLDYRYELKLGNQSFTLTLKILRNKSGIAYGAPVYVIEYDGSQHEYHYGGASSRLRIADLDGDGKPDLIVSVDGNNSGYEAVMLSSKARPGKNPPTASLHSNGC